MPAALNSLLDLVNILVDLMMVGSISPEAIVAVGVSMNFMMLIFSVITLFYVGTNAIISRAVGGKRPEEAYRALFNITLFGFGLSLFITFLAYFASGYFHAFMGVSKEAEQLGEGYLLILSLTLPFVFLKTIFTASLSASGDTKTPFKIKLIGSFLNFLLNYMFIFGNFGAPELGVIGAALSTAAVTLFEASVLYLVLYFNLSYMRFHLSFELSFIKRLLKVGVPTAVERFFTFTSMILFTKFIAIYGTEVLAGYQVGLRIEGLAFMPGVGFMIASMALMGQHIGASDEEGARESVTTTAVIAASLMGLLGVVMLLFPEIFTMWFSKDPQTLAEANLYLRIIGVSQIPLALIFVLDGALRGAGATRTTFLVNTLSIWTLRVLPAFMISHFHLAALYIYLCIAAETFLRAFILWKLFERGIWRGIEV